MRLTSLRRTREQPLAGIIGTARLDRRTRTVVRRIKPGDIAIIDHVDIDRQAAVGLVEAGAAAVVNLAPSVSGRYPNLGPRVLLDAGVALVDQVDPEVFAALDDGDTIRLDGDTMYVGEDVVGRGVLQTSVSIDNALEVAKDGMPQQLEAFSANATEHLRRERSLLLDGEGVPRLSTKVAGRHVLVVSRSFAYRDELRALKTYLRENSPVLVGVDGGADALLEAGYRPDLIVTDFEDISDTALRCGAELVAYTADGRQPAAERTDRLSVSHTTLSTSATGEDAAILLVHFHQAELIVLVGAHSSLVEFLDKGRSAMASSFLTRAAVGSTLIDASAAAKLYGNRVNGWLVLLLLVLGIALVAAAIATTPQGQVWWDEASLWAEDVVDRVRDLLP